MNKQEITKKVKQIIRPYSPGTPKLEWRLGKEITMDSLDVVELVVKLEQSYDIQITDEDAIDYIADKSVQDIINYIIKRIS